MAKEVKEQKPASKYAEGSFLGQIFSPEHDDAKVIELLKEKSVEVPSWELLRSQYYPDLHEIITNKKRRPKDKKGKDYIEKPARVTYDAERIFVNRLLEMMFTIPPTREYVFKGSAAEKKEQRKMRDAIEAVYEDNRIDGENMKRFRSLFAACESLTIWYTVEDEEGKKHDDYGFETPYHLKCRSYSPMEYKESGLASAKIYYLADDFGKCQAISFEYDVKRSKTKTVTFFECYTRKAHYKWMRSSDTKLKYEPLITNESLIIDKIPGIYGYRSKALFENVPNNRDEVEFTLSRNSDVVRKNSHPLVKLIGQLLNGEKPEGDQAREFYNVELGGDVDTVSPAITPENVEYYVNELKKNMAESMQLSNISLENLKACGALNAKAMQMLVAGDHMKVGLEKWDVIEYLDRECNIIKAYLAKMNSAWDGKIQKLKVKQVINPFRFNDDDDSVNTYEKASGGPILSQRTAIEKSGLVSDVDEEMARIKAQQDESTERDRMVELFPGATAGAQKTNPEDEEKEEVK